MFTGKAELGQGLKTALLQVAAEQLDVASSQIDLLTADTALSPNEGITAGSHSMQDSGTAIMNAVQRAFIEEQAAQCGYCIAGMVMRAQALLERNPRPAESEIRTHMAANLCRCGTHMRILAAVRRAASEAKA